jgi:K+-sensing histidine kinase KdpD
VSSAPVSALPEIGLLIAAETELDRVIERTLRATRAQLGAGSASLLLWDPASGGGRRLATLTAEEPRWEERETAIGPSDLTESALQDGTTATEDGTLLATPLRCQGDVLGVLYARFDRPRRAGARARQVIELLGGYAAAAVRNCRLIEAARLDGAIKTAQAAAHELSQPLAVVVGYAELIQDCAEPEDARRYAVLVNRAALDAAARLDKFRNVLRFVELRFGDLEPILDLDKSAATD